MTDWVVILKEQTEVGARMARDVPAMLDNPDISEAQVRALFSELEKQADFVEKLRRALEKLDHDFPSSQPPKGWRSAMPTSPPAWRKS